MKVIYKILAACIALSVFSAGVLAYFIRTVDVDRQIVYDGLGRALSEPPRWAQIFIDQPAWAGAGWHLFDIIVFFGGLFIALWLYGLSPDDTSKSKGYTPKPPPIRPGEPEMMSELLELMASADYANMSEADRKAAEASVRRKYGFSDKF